MCYLLSNSTTIITIWLLLINPTKKRVKLNMDITMIKSNLYLRINITTMGNNMCSKLILLMKYSTVLGTFKKETPNGLTKPRSENPN